MRYLRELFTQSLDYDVFKCQSAKALGGTFCVVVY